MKKLSVEGCEFLDSGSYRHVFIDKSDPGFVLKEAPTEQAMRGSIAEHKIWEAVRDILPLRKWFNPVIAMNADGSVSKSPRIEPVAAREKDSLPVQEWMVDAGWRNWGRSPQGLVLLDYGNPELLHRVLKLIRKEYKP